jgi:RNA polymerase sigma-70 factor (ECF subfamily)
VNVVNERDADWFRGVYVRYYPDVVRYGLRRLGGMAAAEELAQEVFLVTWRRRWEVPARTLPWLYGVGRRLLANHWRAERAAPPALELAVVRSAGSDVLRAGRRCGCQAYRTGW